MTMKEPAMPDTPVTVWNNCYDESWKNEITEGSTSHPAKMARGLVRRIFDYLIETGRLRKNDCVVDCFGGIGTTGIEGASRGMRCFSCELEPRFVSLAQENIELHRKTWEHFGDPIPVIVQGDSRRLCQVLGPVMASCIVSSPPYNLPMSQDHNGNRGGTRGTDPSEKGAFVKYGNTPGQLEGLPMGSVDAVISSPPFTQGYSGGGGINVKGYGPDGKDKVGSRTYQGTGNERVDGNLETLTLGSVDAVVSSPPYEGSLSSDGDMNRRDKVDEKSNGKHWGRNANGTASNDNYGETEGQLGSEKGETFWAAAKEIVAQCHQILRPGGTCVWVTKDFVRDKKRVTFSKDWLRLCESQGFKLVEWIHASLVKTSQPQPDLFGGDPYVKVTKKASFFRRLAESKGSPKIDFEDVLVMEKRSDTEVH